MGFKNIDIKCSLAGQAFNADPVEIEDLTVRAVFDNAQVQPTIVMERCTFTNEAALFVIAYILRGKSGGTGALEAMPFEMTISQDNVVKRVFNGYLDFRKQFLIETPVKVKVQLVMLDSMDDFNRKLEALSFGFLEREGLFQDSDFAKVKAIRRPFDRDMEILQTGFATFMVSTQIAAQAREFGKEAAVIAASAGVLIGYEPLALVLDAIYLGVLIVELINLLEKLIPLILPIPVRHKGMSLRRGCEKIAQYLGYTFNTSIPDIDWVYLPSNPNEKGLTKGIPQSKDYGYQCPDFINLVLDLFCARAAISNGVLEIHNIGSAFWRRNSTYTLPDVLTEPVRYNIEKYVCNKNVSFMTDDIDEWTSRNYFGTSTEIIESAKVVTDKRYALNMGLQKISFPVALGNNSGMFDSVIDAFAAIVNEVNGFIDEINKAFPKLGIKHIASTLVLNDVLKTSQKTWSKPKILFVVGESIPTNHRQKLSSLVVWKNHWVSTSFMPTNPIGQKRMFDNITIPCDFDDFNKLIDNCYCNTASGGLAKIDDMEWKVAHDSAVVNYWVGQVWTTNIKQELITPD